MNDGNVAASVIVTGRHHLEDVTRLAPRRTAATAARGADRGPAARPHHAEPQRDDNPRRTHVSHEAPPPARSTPPAGDLGDDAPAAVGVLCQAESVEIGISGAGTDPFDATLLLSGTDPQGREVAVWIRLTPTTINDLTEQLEEVLLAQQQILGITGHGPTDQDQSAAA